MTLLRGLGTVLPTVLLVVLLAPALPRAEPAEDLSRLAAVMTSWVAERTGLDAPAPPVVERTDQVTLRRKCFPAFRFEDAPEVRGAYDPATGIIYMDDACDPTDLADASYLLHEVVHHVQLFNGLDKTARCRAELEGQALRLQMLWLKEQGTGDPLDLLGTDERTLRMLEKCPR